MRNTIVVTIGALLLTALPLFAASDFFLKIEGVSGESKAPGHEGWIELESFSFGIHQAGTTAYGSGGGEGKASFHDLSFTHKVDKASPVLMKAALTGEHYKNVTLDLHGQRYLLQDVIVTSFQQAGHGNGNAIPQETVKMQYAHDVTHESVAGSVDDKHKVNVGLTLAGKHINNAMFNGLGAPSPALVQSIRLTPGQNNAIIVVCDQNGGANQVLVGLRQAATAPGKQRIPTLGIIIEGGKQPAESKAFHKDRPVETISFTFTEVKVSYTPMAGGCAQVSLNFTRFSGPPTGYDAFLK